MSIIIQRNLFIMIIYRILHQILVFVILFDYIAFENHVILFDVPELTVIIPFLNEGEEVETTIREIKRTAAEAVDIILVNDASNDGFDYDSICERYSRVRYIKHKTRRGSGPAKQAGIDACKTPYFLVIDGHMRFYDDNWWIRIPEAIRTDERAVYCCRCKSWSAETKQENSHSHDGGAYLKFIDKEKRQVLNIQWDMRHTPACGDDNIADIPCVLGACYAATKKYWNYLKGYRGLKKYSCEEAYISIKAWAEGGRCRLINDVMIGHLFRTRFPYKVVSSEYYRNKLLIAELLLPQELRNEIIRCMKAMNYVEYVRARKQIDADKYVPKLKDYLGKILDADEVNRFLNINSAFIEANTRQRP